MKMRFHHSIQRELPHSFSDVLSAVAKFVLLKRPLRFLGLPAAVLLIIGMLWWFQILAEWSSRHDFAIGNALVASVVVMFRFFLGIGALILLAISLALKERPREA